MRAPGYIAVTARRAGFRRAGREWPATPTVVATADFSADQLAALQADPNLVVVPSEGPPDADAPAPAPAPEAAPDLAPADYLVVTARRAGFRRAGREWPATPTVVATADFSADQLAALRSDPNLVVVPVKQEDAGPPPPLGDALTVLDAVRLLAETTPRVDAHWLKSGKPSASALEDIIGANVTSADRDEAWDAYQQGG